VWRRAAWDGLTSVVEQHCSLIYRAKFEGSRFPKCQVFTQFMSRIPVVRWCEGWHIKPEGYSNFSHAVSQLLPGCTASYAPYLVAFKLRLTRTLCLATFHLWLPRLLVSTCIWKIYSARITVQWSIIDKYQHTHYLSIIELKNVRWNIDISTMVILCTLLSSVLNSH